MKNLVVPGDLYASAEILARLKSRLTSSSSSLSSSKDDSVSSSNNKPCVIILTGFPCCTTHTPPMETDGLASVAIARAVVKMGYDAVLVTEECNGPVFVAAVEGVEKEEYSSIRLAFYPSSSSKSKSKWTKDNDDDLKQLAYDADLIIACERAGPAADGNCYTMRGINMNEKGLIAPLHDIVTHARSSSSSSSSATNVNDSNDKVKFIAIGDGGNELGMGKVIEKIHEHIPDGEKIGAVMAADHLIAASVSNWGAYALIAAAALVFAADNRDDVDDDDDDDDDNKNIVEDILPTEEMETRLLHRCVAAGCRDGVSGKMEATVDGMPLERSMECLREIRKVALGE